jgi:hypothetical protein
MTFTVPAEAMQAIVQKAILESIGPEERDAILTEAVRQLMTSEKVEYGRTKEGTSPLQLAFNEAIRVGSIKYVRELVETDEAIQARIREAVGGAIMAALTDEDDSWRVDAQIADAMGRALIDIAKERR